MGGWKDGSALEPQEARLCESEFERFRQVS